MKVYCLVFILINLFYVASNAQNAVVSASKMNVFYMGVDNPIEIAIPNVPSNKINVTIDNQASIQKLNDGNYIVRVMREGEITLTIEANGQITTKKFRAKRIPDPIVMISGGRSNGSYHASCVIASQGLIATLESFDFDARCSIQSFTIFIKSKRGDVYQANVVGGSFPPEVERHIRMLEVGDVVNFSDIKARCPGDSVARDLNSLSYTMRQ